MGENIAQNSKVAGSFCGSNDSRVNRSQHNFRQNFWQPVVVNIGGFLIGRAILVRRF
jgi:hypothetical protein